MQALKESLLESKEGATPTLMVGGTELAEVVKGFELATDVIKLLCNTCQ